MDTQQNVPFNKCGALRSLRADAAKPLLRLRILMRDLKGMPKLSQARLLLHCLGDLYYSQLAHFSFF